MLFGKLRNLTLIDCKANNYGIIKNIAIIDGQAVLITDSESVIADRIVSVGDAVTINDGTLTNSANPIIGKTIYTTKGQYLSEVTDIEMTVKLTVKAILCAQTRVSAGKLVGIADVVLIKNLSPKNPQVVSAPAKRLYGSCDWLIGKQVTKNITNYSGEVILRSGARITANTINHCKLCCKLVELMLYSTRQDNAL